MSGGGGSSSDGGGGDRQAAAKAAMTSQEFSIKLFLAASTFLLFILLFLPIKIITINIIEIKPINNALSQFFIINILKYIIFILEINKLNKKN